MTLSKRTDIFRIYCSRCSSSQEADTAASWEYSAEDIALTDAAGECACRYHGANRLE